MTSLEPIYLLPRYPPKPGIIRSLIAGVKFTGLAKVEYISPGAFHLLLMEKRKV